MNNRYSTTELFGGEGGVTTISMCCHLVVFFQVPLDPSWLDPESKLMESSNEHLTFLPGISRTELAYIYLALDAITSAILYMDVFRICVEYYIDPFIFCQGEFILVVVTRVHKKCS